MIYRVPEEYQFVEEGFGLSKSHDPDEAIYSYVYLYDEAELTFSHSPALNSYFSARYCEGNETIFEVYFEEVTEIKFGGWNGERTIEVSLKNQRDVTVFYNPKARINI